MEQKRLVRTRKDSVIGGVCGGLGRHLNLDPVIIRVIFVLAVIFAGTGLLVYIVLWIVMPLEPENPLVDNIFNKQTVNEDASSFSPVSAPDPVVRKTPRSEGSLWGGLILIVVGMLFLVSRFIPGIHFGDLWPVLLIVVGVILISKSNPSNQKTENE
jgi:phage shock protein C